jgi:flagellar hook-associated protein 2
MTTIQTTTGVVSGIDYKSLVESLMELEAAPKTLLESRNETLEEEQTAVAELSAMLAAVGYLSLNLGKTDLFKKTQVTSSNEGVLTATVTGSPAQGTYKYVCLQTAQSQEFLSTGFKSETTAIGSGTLTFRYGANVQRGTSLDQLGGGTGVELGQIRITDRSGASTQIDLSAAQTVGDILDAINNNSTINVTAEAVGDRIRLIDDTGQTASNLRVQEVNGGTTAASLGLSGINVAASTADGLDMVELSRDIELDALNDGSGVSLNTALPEIQYQLRDGTTGTIDFSPDGSDGVQETTLGDIMDRINAAASGKLKVEIAADGDRFVLTDLTEGENEFTVESMYDSQTLADLGLDGTAVDGVITGRRIQGGLQTVLLSSLGGGNGLGTLGLLELTDRSGASATVDLSGAETLDDVIGLINASGTAITASVNDALNGIKLTDSSGSTSGNLVVANGDDTNTADKLNIAADTASTSVNSGDRHLRVVSENTWLDDLNGGAGVSRGQITIGDSLGNTATLDISGNEYQTVGDVIRGINALDIGIQASINANGDGIYLQDLSHGSTTIEVYEAGGTTSAADLHLIGAPTTVEIDGQATQVIDGSTTYTIELDADDTLEDLCTKIGESAGGLNASVFSDGSSKPYRLQLTSSRSGKAGELVLDVSQLGFTATETMHGRDALLAVGSSRAIIASSTNTFSDVLPGVDLEVQASSSSAITVTIEADTADLVASVQSMVDNYNTFVERLDELTAYDSSTETAAILSGNPTAIRLDTDLARLLSSRFLGVGNVQSLAELGISFNDDGTLAFDQTKLEDRYASDPDAVASFFTTEDTGFSAKFQALLEQLSAEDDSLLAQRLTTLAAKIAKNETKIEEMTERLEKKETALYTRFAALETLISKFQTQLGMLDSIQWINSSDSDDK